jgi:hypothetical protein
MLVVFLGVDAVTLCLSATRTLYQKRKALIARLHQDASRCFARLMPCSGNQRQCLELISTSALVLTKLFVFLVKMRRVRGAGCTVY